MCSIRLLTLILVLVANGVVGVYAAALPLLIIRCAVVVCCSYLTFMTGNLDGYGIAPSANYVRPEPAGETKDFMA